MDKKEHERMIDGMKFRKILSCRLCGKVSTEEMDHYIRMGMTRKEAHRQVLVDKGLTGRKRKK